MTEEFLPQAGAQAGASREELARHEMRTRLTIPPGPDGLSFALFQSLSTPLLPGHRADLVLNGRIFTALVEAIRGARESVHIQVYIWRPCEVSDRICEALIERARAGVACRVVVDPIGSEEIAGDKDFDLKIERHLRSAGCEVHYYRPLKGRVLGRLMSRNHSKIAVIDGRVGFTGGFGIWKVWEGDGLARENWRDTNVRVEGPAVRNLQLAFARAWQESGGDLLPESVFPVLPALGPVRATFTASHGQLGITDAERMCRIIMGAARERLWISNAYFTPVKSIMQVLVNQRARGVDVRVLAPGPIHDVPVIRASQRATYAELLRTGVKIYEYAPSMMHAKTMLVDDWLSVVGSTNLDALSLNKLGEGSMILADTTLAAQLEEAWQRDMQHSKEITLERGGRSTPVRRLARRLTQIVGKDR
jgi:cardiolipin synthase A/B